MHGFLFILLQIVACLTAVIGTAFALQVMADPRLIGRGKGGAVVRMLAFLAAGRSFIVTAATIGAVILQAREAVLWLAGVGVAMQLLDSIQGQVKNSARQLLLPLGLALGQLLLLVLVINTH
jgi:hypothetical protein